MATLSNESFVVTVKLHDTLPLSRVNTWKETNTLEGLDIDLIQALSQMLGFSASLRIVADDTWGLKDPSTGTWNGMIGEVIDGVADMAISSIQVNRERQEYVDFSFPFISLGIAILYVKPHKVPFSLTSFSKPFSNATWWFLGMNTVVMAIILFGFQKIRRAIIEPETMDNENSSAFKNALWSSVARVLGKASSHDQTARSILHCWSLPILMMTALFSATLRSHLVHRGYEKQITDVVDLLDQDDIKYGGGVSNTIPFRDTTNTIYATMWQRMLTFNKTEQVLFRYSEEAYEKVKKGQFALFIESTVLEALLQKDCQFAKVAGLLNKRFYAIVFSKGFKHRQAFNEGILRLQTTGNMKRLERKWLQRLQSEGTCDVLDGNNVPQRMELENLRGVFVVQIIGAFLAVFLSLLEYLWNHWFNVLFGTFIYKSKWRRRLYVSELNCIHTVYSKK